MALIAISGHPGCRFEEVARITAQRLGFELLTQARIRHLTGEEFGAETAIPHKAWASLATSVLARIATEHHIVYCALGGELQAREDRKAKFGKSKATAEMFDLVCNAESLSSEQIAGLVAAAVESGGLKERGLLSHAAEAQLQFQMRLNLARYGIVPPDKITLRQKIFAHQSEEMFANLLDFYRIAWEYEPRSFPIQYDRDGHALESFTPDFYLPEFDLYVELTTMKQAHVTRKNRKVRLLRELYPQINIQVFYQKDFENLIFKYGLTERTVRV